MANLQERVIGALRLQASTYEEVEHDQAATTQAAMLVAAVAVARGLAGIRFAGIGGLIVGIVLSLIGWVIGAVVLWLVGTKLFPGKNTEADLGQMLRTLGFAQAAGLLSILGIVPGLYYLTSFVVGIWILVAMVIAVRQALDYDDTMRAVIVCVVAWAIMLVVTFIGGLFGFGAMMAGSRVL